MKNKSYTFILTLYIVQSINMVVKMFIKEQSFLWDFFSYLSVFILLIVLAFNVKHILKKHTYQFILSQFALIILFSISLLFGNANIVDLIYTYVWAVLGLSALFFVLSVEKQEELYDSILKTSYFLVPLLSISLVYYSMNFASDYSLSLSSMLLIPLLVVLSQSILTKKIWPKVFSAFGILATLFFGGRGPLLSIIFYIFFATLTINEKRKKTRYIITLGVVFVMIILFNENIVSFVVNLLNVFGLKSRNINLIILDLQYNDSGRMFLIQHYIDLIKKKPIFGWGILGGWIDFASGPHNMIIELILAFGIIIGSILTAILLYIFIKSIIYNFKIKNIDLNLIFAASIIRLFLFSGNFFQNYNLFIMIGLFILNEKGLAEVKNDEVNFCESLGTVLAKNEIIVKGENK